MPVCEHIRKLADLLCVCDRLVEGVAEIMRNENGYVCVVGFDILERVTVDDGKVIVIVFLTHETAGVLAESAHLVLEGERVADELGFVQYLVDEFHDLVSDFDTYADIDRAGLMRDVVCGALLFKPVGAASAGCDDRMAGVALDIVALRALYVCAEAFVAVDYELVAFV